MAKIIDGRQISEQMLLNLKAEVETLKLTPSLGIILATDDDTAYTYSALKIKKATEVGIKAELIKLKRLKNYDELEQKIRKIVSDPSFSSFILQLPLYDNVDHFDYQAVDLVPPEKDADGLNSKNLGETLLGNPNAIIPATVAAVLEAISDGIGVDLSWYTITKERKPVLKGKTVTILNNTFLVGIPLANILSLLGATVTIMNEHSPNFIKCILGSDIVVSATGVTEIISSTMIKKGAILIDVTSKNVYGKVKGDFIIDDEMVKKAKAYTPVPGGIGPLTISCLLKNVIELTKRGIL